MAVDLGGVLVSTIVHNAACIYFSIFVLGAATPGCQCSFAPAGNLYGEYFWDEL